jgi:hypothetical protein
VPAEQQNGSVEFNIGIEFHRMRALSLCTRRGGILLPVLLAACALSGAHAQGENKYWV